MYSMDNMAKLGQLGKLDSEGMKGFQALDAAALKDGAIPKKYKEMIALGVALTTQCVYCLEVHKKAAEAAGVTEEELAEVVFIAAALRAGAALTHGTHILNGK
jgi:AhpD family alkylhydroperoxidase